MPPRKPPPSGRYSPQRVAELEAVLAELHRRQDAQPKNAFTRRARLALLIGAFEQTLETTQDNCTKS